LENYSKTVLREALPETWTHWNNCHLKIRFGLKLAGFEFKNDEELVNVLVKLELNNIIERKEMCIRVHPDFSEQI